MRTKPTLPLILALVGAALGVPAASPYRTDINPALIYWQAFSQLPELSPEERQLFDRRQFAPTDERYAALVGRYDTVFRLVRRGVHAKPPADWGVDLGDGPGTLLPHLAKAKAVAQAAQFRARYFLDHGQEDEAVQDLVSALVLGRHIASDGVLISTLVQIAIDNIVGYCVAENFYGFSRPALSRLLAGIDHSPKSRTVSQCIGTGERSFLQWYRGQVEAIQAAHPGDEKQVLKEVRGLLAATLDQQKNYTKADRFIEAAGGTSEGLLALGKSVDALYDEMQAVAALPYDQFESRQGAFFEKIRSSGNPFAREFFPALEKTRGKEFRAQARMEMLLAAIEYRLHGEPGLKSVRDPFGSGPFAFRRFKLEGVDRGFELRSNYAHGDEVPEVIIFVEKAGPAFRVVGPSAGKLIEEP